MELNEKRYKYFKPYEFESCIPACDIHDIDSRFLDILDSCRERAGVPFRINSAYRSVEYEKSKGRTGLSSHTKGLAVDIACSDSRKRYLIVESLISAGIPRIGIHKYYIHADMDFEKRSSIWLYQ